MCVDAMKKGKRNFAAPSCATSGSSDGTKPYACSVYGRTLKTDLANIICISGACNDTLCCDSALLPFLSLWNGGISA